MFSLGDSECIKVGGSFLILFFHLFVTLEREIISFLVTRFFTATLFRTGLI